MEGAARDVSGGWRRAGRLAADRRSPKPAAGVQFLPGPPKHRLPSRREDPPSGFFFGSDAVAGLRRPFPGHFAIITIAFAEFDPV